MGVKRTTSDADRALEKFQELRRSSSLFLRNDKKLSESDTRAKLINPIFKEVLGWREADIRREEPVKNGYVDYVFGSDFPHFHVEAKGTNPRFHLQTRDHPRILQVLGPHLLKSKNNKVKEDPVQAARCAFDLGTEFSILTNGDQSILVKTKLPGKSWREGNALVWHGHDDIERDFAEFFNAFARERVIAGSRHELFKEVEGITQEPYTPIDGIRNPDAELIRNDLWPKISRAFGPLLTDRPEDLEVQEEIVRYCYVRTSIGDQADTEIDAFLRDGLPHFLENSGVIDVTRTEKAGTPFDWSFEADVKGTVPATYILTGGVGSGKTTFWKRFALVSQPRLIEHYCLWVDLDFLPLGTVEPAAISARLQEFTYSGIRNQLSERCKQFLPLDGDSVRSLFDDAAKVEQIIGAFIRSTTAKTRNIVRMLSCVSQGDIRHALGFFNDFVSSGNTDIEKILRIIPNSSDYAVPFHEFVKSAILGSRRFYRASSSHVVNLFAPTVAPRSSHHAGCRLLARLSAARNTASPHGEGFVDTTRILNEYRRSFGSADDLLAKGKELLDRGLVESEPPRIRDLERSDALRISASGAYYWQFLARSFAYLDLVLVDTPLSDKGKADTLATLADIRDLTTRFERVRLFVDYLEMTEKEELGRVSQRGGPYSASLVSEIKNRIEKEIEVIKQKTGAMDLNDGGVRGNE